MNGEWKEAAGDFRAPAWKAKNLVKVTDGPNVIPQYKS
jgi:hypothetical protein